MARSPRVPHENRDAVCGVLFAVAAIVATIHVWERNLDVVFWMACGVAVGSALLAHRKWVLVAVPLAIIAFRFAVAGMIAGSGAYLLIAAITGGTLFGLLWWRRHDP